MASVKKNEALLEVRKELLHLKSNFDSSTKVDAVFKKKNEIKNSFRKTYQSH